MARIVRAQTRPTWPLLAALGEFAGGLLLTSGLLSPLGPVMIMAAILMAIAKVHWSNGLWVTNGGVEYPLVLFVVMGVLGLLGAGRYSVDAVLGSHCPCL